MSEIDKLYAAVLGLSEPWKIDRVETDLKGRRSARVGGAAEG